MFTHQAHSLQRLVDFLIHYNFITQAHKLKIKVQSNARIVSLTKSTNEAAIGDLKFKVS